MFGNAKCTLCTGFCHKLKVCIKKDLRLLLIYFPLCKIYLHFVVVHGTTRLKYISQSKELLRQWFITGDVAAQSANCQSYNRLQRSTVVPVSVAKGPKFRPQNSKGALQKFVRPEISAAEFSLNMPKKGRKGAELF
jgi:hypothetical protein